MKVAEQAPLGDDNLSCSCSRGPISDQLDHSVSGRDLESDKVNFEDKYEVERFLTVLGNGNLVICDPAPHLFSRELPISYHLCEVNLFYAEDQGWNDIESADYYKYFI